jgi:FkbM family methyltransferase
VLKTTLRQLLNRWGYKVTNLSQIPPAFLNEENLLKITFDLMVAQQLSQSSDFSFIQVGAFDGVECDPIRKFILKHAWKGVLIEPQKNAFAQLKRNYSDQPQLSFKNAAIANQRTTRRLYTVGHGDVPAWCQSLASFDRDVILKHKDLVPHLEELIEIEEVECITFADLIEEFGLQKVDLLQVDVEGYDAEIISMFPFHLVKPNLVHFERKHLSLDELERCLKVLVRNEYKFANDGAEDLVAYCDGGSH